MDYQATPTLILDIQVLSDMQMIINLQLSCLMQIIVSILIWFMAIVITTIFWKCMTMSIKFYHYLRREDNFIAGHSMGGYGTSKYALTQSQRFSKAAMLSAAFNVSLLREYEYYDFCPEAIVGENEDIKGTPFDPYYLVDKAVTNNVDLPELLIMCGTEDALYQDNLDFIRYLNEKGVNYHFEKSSGDHDYAYWDKAIKQVIETFTRG